MFWALCSFPHEVIIHLNLESFNGVMGGLKLQAQNIC